MSASSKQPPNPFEIAWRTTLRPLITGGVLGFIGAMLMLGLLEMAGVPSEGSGEPGWFDSVVALTFFLSWAGIAYAMRTRALRELSGKRKRRVKQKAVSKNTLLREQLKRIESKARRLKAEAQKVPLYRSVAEIMPQLISQARQLVEEYERLCELDAEISLNAGEISEAGELTGNAALAAELEAGREAQYRLEQLLAANHTRQQLCLSRLDRIEDLVDSARLEIAHPASLMEPTGKSNLTTTVLDDLNNELRTSREALEEVER